MICKKCGSVISDDAKFCNFCGEAQEVVAQETYTEMPVQEDQPLYAEEPAKQGKGKGLAIASLVLGIVSVVLALAGICCCGAFSWTLSIVPAIVGLILAIVAKKKGFTGGMVKAGLILNIIAIVVTAIILLVSVILIIVALAGGGGFESIMEEFMEGFEEGFNAGYGSSAKSYSDSIYSDYYAVKSVISSLLK